MQINIYNSVDQAILATGITVVIDVFRAFSTEAYIFDNHVNYIIPVGTLEEAYDLKNANPDYILVGERGGLKPELFDLGNSPTEVLNYDFTGKVVIHTSSNGTKGLLLATKASEVLTGAFVNAGAIIKYIQAKNPEQVSLVSTAPLAYGDNNEDLMLANYIQDRLNQKIINHSELKELLATTDTYKYLFTEARVPASDFDLCLEFNRFDFIIAQEIIAGRKVLVRKNI